MIRILVSLLLSSTAFNITAPNHLPGKQVRPFNIIPTTAQTTDPESSDTPSDNPTPPPTPTTQALSHVLIGPASYPNPAPYPNPASK